jgi:DNA invertase Pin-like site-specific DNA recombinase
MTTPSILDSDLAALAAKYGGIEGLTKALQRTSLSNAPPATKKGFGYCRVSTEMQLDGISIETQKSIIIDYAAKNGVEVIKLYEEKGLSGGAKLHKRPALMSLLEDLTPEMVVVVSNTDRLIRGSLVEGAALENLIKEKRCSILAPNYMPDDDENPEVEFIRGVKSLTDNFERMKTKQKIRQSMRYLSGQKLLRGRPSWGWKFVGKDKPWDEEPREMQIVERIRQIKIEKPTTTPTQIAKTLNTEFGYAREFKDKEGKVTRQSKFWNNTVSGIMKEYEIVDREPIEQRKLPRSIKVSQGGTITPVPSISSTTYPLMTPAKPIQSYSMETPSPEAVIIHHGSPWN